MTASNGETSVRRFASEILLKVDNRKAFADILLDQEIRTGKLGERDRALLTELVYGTLRWRGTIDARLSNYLRRPLVDTDPFIRNLLRVTLYQLLFLDKIPDYAAVNEAVQLTKNRGGGKAAGFVNGVLRNFLRRNIETAAPQATDDSIAALAMDYSHPEWLVKRWIDYFGLEAAKALMRANNERSPLVLRVNTRKNDRKAFLELLKRNGVTATATRWSPQGLWIQSGSAVDELPGFHQGLFQVQGEASQLVTYLLAPQPGERVLDACAAPGGKSTHIAELMNDAGEVTALDISARGIEKIRDNATRLGLTSIRALRSDASRDFPGSFLGHFERVLVDAPCSGLGTLRSHPEIKWHRNPRDIERLGRLQEKILDRVASCLKPGGVLVYSTCTLTRDENEQVAERFLKTHQEFELQNAAGYLPEQAKWSPTGEAVASSSTPVERNPEREPPTKVGARVEGPMVQGSYFMALPHRHNTDGFFAARMRKVT
ncbi:MAG: 16S rRNA (cytosine(967)-C(5))-methyltransferase RsmB [Deltaproteobacteria bacterium]|nr:16S rRNA (cytosine(967)-C(5))-methyltransferase RsmB [Deltaproteobacteria bacterium]MBI2228599.1 16S rRNA (cytosine(967)-C(5))-methyltransferase RsmB [Deltaproteobacteria bacterium]MBI2531549.1 16S rRNA (cytosine(967)-C(5))-methyltransferase RsmB [Deltaproteobacteria bacterium]